MKKQINKYIYVFFLNLLWCPDGLPQIFLMEESPAFSTFSFPIRFLAADACARATLDMFSGGEVLVSTFPCRKGDTPFGSPRKARRCACRRIGSHFVSASDAMYDVRDRQAFK